LIDLLLLIFVFLHILRKRFRNQSVQNVKLSFLTIVVPRLEF